MPLILRAGFTVLKICHSVGVYPRRYEFDKLYFSSVPQLSCMTNVSLVYSRSIWTQLPRDECHIIMASCIDFRAHSDRLVTSYIYDSRRGPN